MLWDVNAARECVDSGILGAGPDCTTNQLIIVRLQFSKLQNEKSEQVAF